MQASTRNCDSPGKASEHIMDWKYRAGMDVKAGAPEEDGGLYKQPGSHDGRGSVLSIFRKPGGLRQAGIMLLSGVFLIHSFLLLLYKIYPAAAQGSASQWQSNLKTWSSSSPSWQKYVRSPPTTTIRPSKVLSQYTVGNVKNPDGLVSGNGPTVLTRSPSAAANETAANHSIADVTPSIVVDWGQNIAGFVSITFAGASNSTPGLPGIRLAFSETLQYLTNVSDFSRSDNVSFEESF